MAPLTVRLLSRSRDVYLDLGGGNRIPKISERQARSVAELRSAGVGVSRVLLVHSGTAEGSDLFKAVLTMLDPHVAMSVVPLPCQRRRTAPEGDLLGASRTWSGPSNCDANWTSRSCPRAIRPRASCNWPSARQYDVVIIGRASESSPPRRRRSTSTTSCVMPRAGSAW